MPKRLRRDREKDSRRTLPTKTVQRTRMVLPKSLRFFIATILGEATFGFVPKKFCTSTLTIHDETTSVQKTNTFALDSLTKEK
jgi:hypothetical protein